MAKNNQHFFDNPRNIRIVLYVFYTCCVALFILDFIIHRHIYHHWEGLLGFYAVYGFLGCVVLVLIAKWMRTFLMRDEDYYDREELDPVEVSREEGEKHVV
jgi:hypothetical protein